MAIALQAFLAAQLGLAIGAKIGDTGANGPRKLRGSS